MMTIRVLVCVAGLSLCLGVSALAAGQAKKGAVADDPRFQFGVQTLPIKPPAFTGGSAAGNLGIGVTGRGDFIGGFRDPNRFIIPTPAPLPKPPCEKPGDKPDDKPPTCEKPPQCGTPPVHRPPCVIYRPRPVVYVVTDGVSMTTGGEITQAAYTPPTPASTTPPVPPKELTLAEKAASLMAQGKPLDAAKLLRESVGASEKDADDVRLLGLAMLDSGKLSEGASLLRMAYRLTPTLAREAFSIDAVGLDAARVRGAIKKLSTDGHKVPSASTWFAVAVLMQAEGRLDLSERMLARSKKLGLEDAIAQEFATALAKE